MFVFIYIAIIYGDQKDKKPDYIEGTLKYLLKEIEMYVREKPMIYPNEFTIPSHFLWDEFKYIQAPCIQKFRPNLYDSVVIVCIGKNWRNCVRASDIFPNILTYLDGLLN